MIVDDANFKFLVNEMRRTFGDRAAVVAKEQAAAAILNDRVRSVWLLIADALS